MFLFPDSPGKWDHASGHASRIVPAAVAALVSRSLAVLHPSVGSVLAPTRVLPAQAWAHRLGRGALLPICLLSTPLGALVA